MLAASTTSESESLTGRGEAVLALDCAELLMSLLLSLCCCILMSLLHHHLSLSPAYMWHTAGHVAST
jgi:hypothetical protein